MSREQAQNIIRDIEKRGFRAYLVGGCVRDLLLGRMPEDWDIASSARPEQIMEIFGAQALAFAKDFVTFVTAGLPIGLMLFWKGRGY